AREPVAKALRGSLRMGFMTGAIAIVMTVASFLIWPVQDLNSPIGAVKQVYWSAASAENASTKQSFGDVSWTFGITSFVAPSADRYPSGVPSNPYFWDLRSQNYSSIGWAAVLAWLIVLTSGAVAAANDKMFRPVWATAGLWIVVNVVLHSYWQFRDSVFLYAAHSHTAFFLFAVAGAAWAQ